MMVLKFLGTLNALPHSLFGLLLMLIPAWKHLEKGWVLFPYFPRKVRRVGWIIHFIAGCVIPPGIDKNHDGDFNDPGDFRTGAQTHGSFHWYESETNWDWVPLVQHETRHTKQEWVFGILYLPLYGGAFVVNWIRFKGDSVKAYQAIPFEKDARKHEVEQ